MKPSSDATALPAVLVGTAGWLVALIVLGVSQPVGPPATGVWWFAVAVVGALSGLIGLPFLFRKRARLLRAGRTGGGTGALAGD